MKRVRMNSLSAGPKGIRLAGSEYNLGDAEADGLITGGFAVEVAAGLLDEPAEAPPEKSFNDELAGMTKPELVAFAFDRYSLELSEKSKRDELVSAVLAAEEEALAAEQGDDDSGGADEDGDKDDDWDDDDPPRTGSGDEPVRRRSSASE